MSAAEIGTFEVTASAAEVSAFRRAARLEGNGGALPFTYPIRWLARPEVRGALMALMPEADLVPFHESQSFDYMRPLHTDTPYTLAVKARRDSEPDRLVVEVTIAAAGLQVATVETVLRLFPTGRAAA